MSENALHDDIAALDWALQAALSDRSSPPFVVDSLRSMLKRAREQQTLQAGNSNQATCQSE